MIGKMTWVVAVGFWAWILSLAACAPDKSEKTNQSGHDAGAQQQAIDLLSDQEALARVDALLQDKKNSVSPVAQEEAESGRERADVVDVIGSGDLAFSLAFKHVDEEPVDHVAAAKKFLQEDDLAQAMLELEKALYDDPRNKQAAMLLGRTARKSGDDELASDAFFLAAEIDPAADAPWLQLSRLTLERGQLDDAEQMLRRALRLKSDRAESYNLLGRVWLGRSHWQRAVLNFQQALRLGKDSIHYRNNLGFAYLLMKDFGRAVKVLEPLARVDDVPVYMLNNLGLAYEGVGRIQDALALFKTASERNPAYLKSKLNMDRLIQVAKASAEITESAVVSDETTDAPGDLILPEVD